MIKFAALLQHFMDLGAKLKTPICTLTTDMICSFNLKSVEQKDTIEQCNRTGLYHIGLP